MEHAGLYAVFTHENMSLKVGEGVGEETKRDIQRQTVCETERGGGREREGGEMRKMGMGGGGRKEEREGG